MKGANAKTLERAPKTDQNTLFLSALSTPLLFPHPQHAKTAIPIPGRTCQHFIISAFNVRHTPSLTTLDFASPLPSLAI